MALRTLPNLTCANLRYFLIFASGDLRAMELRKGYPIAAVRRPPEIYIHPPAPADQVLFRLPINRKKLG